MATTNKRDRIAKEDAQVEVWVYHDWMKVEDINNCESQFDAFLVYEDLVGLQEFLQMESYPIGETVRKGTLRLRVYATSQD